MSTQKIGSIRPSPLGSRFDIRLKSESKIGCSFYRTQCTHCDIPLLGGNTRPFENNRLLEEAIQQLGTDASRVKQLNLYCSGNILDRHEISEETFSNALLYTRASFPNLVCLGVDSRPEIALASPGVARIQYALALLRPFGSTRFELIVGYETQDAHLRISEAGLNKKITDAHMEAVFRLAAHFGLGLQINVMLMPVPTLSLEDAVTEAEKTIQQVAAWKKALDVEHVLINLHPLYITRKMVAVFGEAILSHPLPSTPAITEVLRRCGHLLPLFVGLDDEGLSIK